MACKFFTILARLLKYKQSFSKISNIILAYWNNLLINILENRKILHLWVLADIIKFSIFLSSFLNIIWII